MIRNPSMIAETVCETGISKTQQKISKTLILAVMAGAYIGFGAQIATIVATDASQYVGVGLSKVMVGVVFSVGLMLVLLAGAELFTGNNLIYVSYFCKRVSWAELLRNWAVVYLGNFLGSVLLVWIIFEAGLYTMNGNTLGLTAISIANGKVNLTFTQVFLRGVLCNWLVCLAVWMASSAENTMGKMLSCVFPIMAFVASGFEHSVANMFFVPMGILLRGVAPLAAQSGLNLQNLTWAGFINSNLIPVTLGNLWGEPSSWRHSTVTCI
jgi:formate/nitrite transporter